MADEERNAQDVTELEAALASLSPRASRVDRDQLLYLAGRASAEQTSVGNLRRPWLWPAATAVSASAAVVLAVLLLARPEPRVVERIVYVPQPREAEGQQNQKTSHDQPAPLMADEHVDSSPAVPATDPIWSVTDGRGTNYLRLRQMVLASGVDALPAPAFSGSNLAEPPASYREMSDRLLKADPSGKSAPNLNYRLFDRLWPSNQGENL